METFKLTPIKKSGFTLIEILIVIAIIGILAAISIPQFSSYKVRAYDAQVKTDLKKIFSACKAYWADNTSSDSCSVGILTSSAYGYTQASNIFLSVSDGTELGFSAVSYHTTSSTSYTINSSGNIE